MTEQERLKRAQRAAARIGRVVTKPSPNVIDRLELLAELGGEATISQMVQHEQGGLRCYYYERMQMLLALGLVVTKGRGIKCEPYRYCITQAGEWLVAHQ